MQNSAMDIYFDGWDVLLHPVSGIGGNMDAELENADLEKIELEYMTFMIRGLDNNGALYVLGSTTSVTELGEMYFMLQATETKIETKKQGNFKPMRMGGADGRPQVIDLISVIQQNHKIVLTGDPGAGKTTSLLYIATLLPELNRKAPAFRHGDIR